jgi:hypothetical protein
MRAKLLLLILLTACASEHDLTDAAGGGAAGGRPEPSVSVDQFVAPSDVGVSTEALTQSFAFINNENGAQINRSNTSWDGLRCWVMRRCTTGCTNHDVHVQLAHARQHQVRQDNGRNLRDELRAERLQYHPARQRRRGDRRVHVRHRLNLRVQERQCRRLALHAVQARVQRRDTDGQHEPALTLA